MARLFLIDHSLKSTGTHHFDLFDSLARTGQDLGIDVVGAASIKLPARVDAELTCPVHRCFRDSVYQNCSELAGLRKLKRVPGSGLPPKAGVFKRVLNWNANRKLAMERERFIRRFSRECGSVFSKVEFQIDDQVLFLGVSELEVLAALNYLAGFPHTIHATWQFLFHFDVFDGSPCTYPKQLKDLRALTSRVSNSLRCLPYHQIRFLATTEMLAEQYMRLGLPKVGIFSYPIADEFTLPDRISIQMNRNEESVPLRLLVAGGVRREKGQQEALPVLAAAAANSRKNGTDIELVVQRQRRSHWLPQKLNVPAGDCCTKDVVRFVQHPLPKNAYVDLMQDADCGVLLYDRSSYASRRAGVLGEFLAMGKPVIVSAGSWLSNQLAECHVRHSQRLAREFTILSNVAASEIRFSSNNVPQPGNIWSFDRDKNPFEAEFEIPPNAGGLVVDFLWHFPRFLGSYSRWQLTVDGQQVGLSQVLGYTRTTGQQSMFIPTQPLNKHQTAKLRITNPYSNSAHSVRNVNISILDSKAARQPISAVGLCVSELSEFPWVLDELIQHFDHYRDTAESFSIDWRKQHSAIKTLSTLFPADPKPQKVA